MYIIATENKWMIEEIREMSYLGWQNPAWDEDGYFWTTKKCISDILKEGNNTEEHPFLFNTEEQAKEKAKEIGIEKYIVVELL